MLAKTKNAARSKRGLSRLRVAVNKQNVFFFALIFIEPTSWVAAVRVWQEPQKNSSDVLLRLRIVLTLKKTGAKDPGSPQAGNYDPTS